MRRALILLALLLAGCSATSASSDASDATGGGGAAGQGEAARGGTGGSAGRGGGGGDAGAGGGIACGDRACLPGEICINFAQYGGFPIDGGFTMSPLTPTCTVVPAACGSQPPSCAACLISALGCSSPGVCQDVGPRTFTCILGGA